MPEPLTAKVGVVVAVITLLFASFKVRLRIEVEVPSAVTGPLPPRVEVLAEGAPGFTVTWGSVLVTEAPFSVAWIVVGVPAVVPVKFAVYVPLP